MTIVIIALKVNSKVNFFMEDCILFLFVFVCFIPLFVFFSTFPLMLCIFVLYSILFFSPPSSSLPAEGAMLCWAININSQKDSV